MKIALVHDHLLEFGGAERVFVALKKIFPQADIYTSIYDKRVIEKYIPDFNVSNIYVSWVSKIPFYKKIYSPLRFITPWIWESFDFTSYDVVISSSGWFMSKGIITKPNTKHFSYIHHPPAALYFYQTAIEWQKHLPIKIYGHFINHFLRMWDYISSQRPDAIIANSKETQGRIKKFYHRSSTIIYPPVFVPQNEPLHERSKKKYFVVLTRLAYKKHVDLIIHTANQYKLNLKIIGTGRNENELRSIAGPTVEFLGYIPDKDLINIYKRAIAFINASEDEEFGIAPVEAMSYGVPVIAYASGGLKETVIDGINGYFYKKLTKDALVEKIDKIKGLDSKTYEIMCRNARKEAEKYSYEVFEKKIKKLIGILNT